MLSSFKTSTKMIIIVIISLVSIISVIVFNYNYTKESLSELQNDILTNSIKSCSMASWNYINGFYGSIALNNGKLVDKNGNDIYGKTDMVDKISKDLNIIAAVFIKDKNDFKSISSSILDEKGERALDTYLEKSSAAYPSVSEGKQYIGEVKILNKSYFAVYSPIKADNGDIVGLMFLGIPHDEIDNQIQKYIYNYAVKTLIISALVLMILTVIVISLAKSIFRPLSSAKNQLEAISTGDFSSKMQNKINNSMESVSGEEAEGAADIAGRASEVSSMSSEILSMVANSEISADMLREEIAKSKYKKLLINKKLFFIH